MKILRPGEPYFAENPEQHNHIALTMAPIVTRNIRQNVLSCLLAMLLINKLCQGISKNILD